MTSDLSSSIIDLGYQVSKALEASTASNLDGVDDRVANAVADVSLLFGFNAAQLFAVSSGVFLLTILVT